ncbi:MAG: glycosyltransferase [Paramuribaculum sp.]|nr:glycosyltransferase [Paramuribaculum sp.]
MKVALVCNSDLLGGASVVTYRLMHALRHQGVDARMIVYTKMSEDKEVELVGTRFMRGLCFMSERARIMLANKFDRDTLFKVSIANVGYPLHRHPWIKKADVICLNWINQGLLSLSGVEALGKLKKPIVWTMHDMWNCTGICHHAYECTNYTRECGCCPMLHSDKPGDLSHKVWRKKLKLYDSVPINFVAVSRWLADKCAESSLLGSRKVRVIPNAFPVDAFTTEMTGDSPLLNIDYSRKIILMGAARLDDTIKGIEYAIEALNILFDNYPAVANKCTAVFFGSLRNPAVLGNLRFPHSWVGRINDPETVRKLYACSKVVLSTSLYETLPGTLIEGQAAGCIPVTFGAGGQKDIVTHLKDGYIAKYRDAVDVAAGIRWALTAEVDRKKLHESVRERFSSHMVAKRYIELFNEIIG